MIVSILGHFERFCTPSLHESIKTWRDDGNFGNGIYTDGEWNYYLDIDEDGDIEEECPNNIKVPYWI